MGVAVIEAAAEGAARIADRLLAVGAPGIALLGGLAEPLDRPTDAESIRGAKEWLSSNMRPGQVYSATRHQAAFSAILDLTEARQARSFCKFEKEIGRLLGWP